MTRRWTTLAALVPLLGLVALALRAEYARLHGPVWTIPIDGYDPRDLLHGQYLRYQFRLQWRGANACGDERRPTAGCCLCLTRDAADGFDPYVRQVRCDATTACDGLVRADEMAPPRRHFVPEDRAAALESALRTHAAAIELTVDPTGAPAVRDLVLDRRPWRDVLDP